MQALLPLAVLFLGVQISVAPPASSPPQPTAEAKRQIESRRDRLKQLNLWIIQPARAIGDADARETLAQLAAALANRDEFVYDAAVSDLVNGMYRTFPPDDLKAVLLPALKTPETTSIRQRGQSFVMEYLARHYGPKAKEALPDLLKIIRDDKLSAYLRGQAIDYAAKIGFGDPALVAAFIDAIENPNPTDSSGVHNRAAYLLGDMGKAAWPAKKAIAKLLDHPWYRDPAYISLGKLAMDDPPQPLAVYLDRLKRVNELPLEQAAAAFLHVQKLVCPEAPIRDTGYAAPHAAAKSVPGAAAAARPVLLRILEDAPEDSLPALAALRDLQVMGPGGSERAARVLVRNILLPPSNKTNGLRGESAKVLNIFEPADPKAVPILADALVRLLDGSDYVTRTTLAQALGRYGKDGRAAVPALLRALAAARAPRGFMAMEEVAAYADALVAVGDVPEARAALLHLLDLDSPLLKAMPADRARLRVQLFTALAHFGLPASGEERDALMDRLRAGLSASSPDLFSAAAGVVAAQGQSYTPREANQLIPLLRRPLSAATWGQSEPGKKVVRQEGDRVRTAVSGVRALGALGPNAREVLGELDALAARPLQPAGAFTPKPAANAVTREALKAAERIRGR
jgi:hypothetical protein